MKKKEAQVRETGLGVPAGMALEARLIFPARRFVEVLVQETVVAG